MAISSLVDDGHIFCSVRLREMLLRLIAGAKGYVASMILSFLASSEEMNSLMKSPCASTGELNFLSN